MSTKVTVGTRNGRVVLVAEDDDEVMGLEFGVQEAADLSEALIDAALRLALEERLAAGEVPS